MRKVDVFDAQCCRLIGAHAGVDQPGDVAPAVRILEAPSRIGTSDAVNARERGVQAGVQSRSAREACLIHRDDPSPDNTVQEPTQDRQRVNTGRGAPLPFQHHLFDVACGELLESEVAEPRLHSQPLTAVIGSCGRCTDAALTLQSHSAPVPCR